MGELCAGAVFSAIVFIRCQQTYGKYGHLELVIRLNAIKTTMR